MSALRTAAVPRQKGLFLIDFIFTAPFVGFASRHAKSDVIYELIYGEDRDLGLRDREKILSAANKILPG
jgi:hypothetical protein